MARTFKHKLGRLAGVMSMTAAGGLGLVHLAYADSDFWHGLDPIVLYLVLSGAIGGCLIGVRLTRPTPSPDVGEQRLTTALSVSLLAVTSLGLIASLFVLVLVSLSGQYGIPDFESEGSIPSTELIRGHDQFLVQEYDLRGIYLDDDQGGLAFEYVTSLRDPADFAAGVAGLAAKRGWERLPDLDGALRFQRKETIGDLMEEARVLMTPSSGIVRVVWVCETHSREIWFLLRE